LQVPYLSKTRIETYEQCPKKYYYLYEQGMDQETVQLVFGSLIHDVLERWFKEDHATFKGDTDKDKILWLYRQVWPNYNLADMEYYLVGKEMLMRFVDQFDYNKYAPYIVAVEKEFELAVEDSDGNKVPIKGVIDFLLHYGDGHYHVFDWKTSVVPKSQWEVDNDIQLGIYNIAVLHEYPDAKQVDLTLWYLRDGYGPVFTKRTQTQLRDLVDFLSATYRRIQQDNDPQAKFNKWCQYCPAKNICEVYQAKLAEPVVKVDFEKINLEELVSTWEETNHKIKALTAQKQEIEKMVMKILETMPRGEFTVGNKQVYLRAQKKSSYDPVLLSRILDYEDFVKVASVTKKNVEALLKEKPELREDAVKALKEWAEAPRPDIRKVE